MRKLWLFAATVMLTAATASAEVVRIEVLRRDDYPTYERVIGRVHFAVQPDAPANRAIADVALAPKAADGRVEFSSDLLFFRPKNAAAARGAVFLEVVNRGIDQSLGLMSDAHTSNYDPEQWDLGDRFVLEQGFTLAFLGWQFDAERGLMFRAPVAPVTGIVRGAYIDDGTAPHPRGFALSYCADDPKQADAKLFYRSGYDAPPREIARDSWRFTDDGCAAILPPEVSAGSYEAVYRAKSSPVAGLGMAAIRDFASYLKFGGATAVLRDNPAQLRRVIGFGYSQSARFLRDFVRDGFNQDERGRQAFDALLISSAGAGGGSFNHRFAMPGQAGNSVLSMLRPVDLPPFTDEGLLARANAAKVTPKIFYTFSSTEYWARAGSLTHTADDGQSDVPLASTSRLYFLTGTPHASGPLPQRRGVRYRGYQQGVNFAQQRWALRALLLDLDDWVARGTEPPPSRYPTIARGELVTRDAVRFPTIPGLAFAPYMPPVYRMDYGAGFETTRVITQEPPALGAAYTVRIPQVNADGNDVGGVPLLEVAVPLGTFTGWNISSPPLPGLRYLAGLIGSFEPFALTREERERSGDARRSVAERYMGKDDYLAQIRRAADDLVRQRFMRAEDVIPAMNRAEAMWDALGN